MKLDHPDEKDLVSTFPCFLQRRQLGSCRLLIYSHDTFGLGHLRRCRALAHALVDHYRELSVLIITGSSIMGRFDFEPRVDFVRLPGVIKLHNGNYQPMTLPINMSDTMKLRKSIIYHTAKAYAPDIFLVDKEPLGLKGEVKRTLKLFRNSATRTILGLRDVLDDQDLLRREWNKKKVWPALEELYDEIWIYGSKEMGDPLAGQSVSESVRQKMLFTGYLRRELPPRHERYITPVPQGPYFLITPGGGGDGVEMVDWVLRAYETEEGCALSQGVFVLGPFMPVAEQTKFLKRAERLKNVVMISFDSQIEHLLAHADGVVAMGGYNTFCEILSFNRPALIVPRYEPRREQLIRTQKASELGLVRMINVLGERKTGEMVAALRDLSTCPPPSVSLLPGTLGGLENVIARVGGLVSDTMRGVHA